MKLTMSAKSLTASLKTVAPAVATRSGLPILSGVRLEPSKDGLAIEATDLELTARRTHTDVAVETEGVAVVSAKALAKAVASISKSDIELESTPNGGRASLDVRAGTRTLTLQGWAGEDWPAIPRLSEIAPVASVDAAAAADALARAAVCASDDQARPVLGAVALFFGQDPPCLEVVATDSYRLGAVRLSLASAPRVAEKPLLVPARACRILARQLKGVRGVLEIRALQASAERGPGADQVGFAVAGANWTIRPIDGEFPHIVGNPWHVDETYLKVGGTWRYLFRAIDQFGQVIDVYLSPRRDATAARRFFAQAIGRTRLSPVEITTDRYRLYPRVIDELLPAAFHDIEVHANNPLETDHGRLKARIRPMRGLKRDRTARVIVAAHAFVQNLRRGFYDLGTDVPPAFRLADAFSELALVI